jgi:hypothetical protein
MIAAIDAPSHRTHFFSRNRWLPQARKSKRHDNSRGKLHFLDNRKQRY